MIFRLISRPQRAKIRDITRTAMISCGGNKQLAISQAIDRVTAEKIVSSIFLWLAIELIKALVIYYIRNNILVPPREYTVGEPGF